jgi:tRNA uridine 5-carboxymethylaminomethyl modification enzyme
MSVTDYDAIVVGAGHAGIETSLSIARAGFRVLLVTMDKKAIGRMSCNPAIGGIAKGHMVREIDALGGEMGLAIDATGVQFRMLNRSKGPAVWSPRAQADKKLYSEYMQRVVAEEKKIDLKEMHVTGLVLCDGECHGVRCENGEEILSKFVILTTGTFLQGLIHVGEKNHPGGRTGEKPAVGMSEALKEAGIKLVRFKTGTPPRLHRHTIDWDSLEEQKGDDPPQPFSFRTKNFNPKQFSCHMTRTDERVHRLIQDNLHRSPLYAGNITGTGTRYCPSIEDKIVKFADKTSHLIYLEPEGWETDEVYVNGLSTSLPEDVQRGIVKLIPGLEKAEFVRLGYAIEYDCAPPTQLYHSLETKATKNLFLAGQINCTSGYEEAASQGLLAGLNVIRRLRQEPPFVLDRSEAYMGVLIDDLVTRGTNEPYRMFTSRAEFRLLLRQDNADERLMKYGHDFGLISDKDFQETETKIERIKTDIQILRKKQHLSHSLERFLKRPEISYKYILDNDLHSSDLNQNERERVEIEVKYEGYIVRQGQDVAKLKKLEKKKIPSSIDYKKVHGLSREALDKFSLVRPESIAQASRIPGISNCDLSLLAMHLEKNAKVFSEE